jgi:hypothetical protein
MKFIFTLLLLFNMNQLVAADSKKEAIDLLANKTIADFQKAIEVYNQKKDPAAPMISRIGKQNYTFLVNKTTVRFTLVNYLNDQMYVNEQLVKRSTFGIKKTSYISVIMASALASSEVTLDGATTRVMLTALGELSGHLEEIGMLCFSDCQKGTRENNLKKIIGTLSQQHSDCQGQLYAQEDTIKKYPSFKMVSMLHSVFNPEFQSVRNFFLKISEVTKNSEDSFMTEKLGIEKNYPNCMGVMTSGTIADGSLDSLNRGILAIKAQGPAGMAMEKSIEVARNICIKMDELKSCLVELKKNVNAINTIKRNVRKATGIEYSPEEKLPGSGVLSR